MQIEKLVGAVMPPPGLPKSLERNGAVSATSGVPISRPAPSRMEEPGAALHVNDAGETSARQPPPLASP